jgi:pilus assembly protein CpaB
MNRKRLLLIGAIALIVAGLVSWKILDVVRASTASANVSTAKVVVAAKDLTAGQQITSSDVTLVAMPGTVVPEGAFHEVKNVLDLGVIVPIQANEIVLRSKVAGRDEGAGLPSMIPSGMRAVSVKVNDVIAVAGFVVPGTHVDVIVTSTPPTGSEPATTTVLQNVPVLAAGKKLQRDSEGKPQDVPVITLLVSPDDAQLLTLAGSEGKIQLALRNPTDIEKQTTSTVHKQVLYGAPAAAAPQKAKVVRGGHPPKVDKMPQPVASTYTVEVIRGEKREVAKFDEGK